MTIGARALFEAAQLEFLNHAMPASAAHVESLRLVVCCPEWGWMPARLRIGPDQVELEFSDVYPPILDFLVWVEGIAAGREVDPVRVHDEYDDHYFHASGTEQPELLRFEYLRATPGGGLYHKALVRRRELLAEFHGMLKFLVDLDLAAQEAAGSPTRFLFDAQSDDIIPLDLSRIEQCL